MSQTAVRFAMLAAVLALAAPSFAGAPSRSSSIALAGSPSYGDLVSFEVSTTDTAYPWVHLKCFQNGTMVAEGRETYYEGGYSDGEFGLYSPMWTGGAADCTAWLEYYTANGRWKQLASTSFHVTA
jgi:hypothetical protein